MDYAGLGYRQVLGSCERRNETLGSKKLGEVLQQLKDYRLLEKDISAMSQLVCQFVIVYITRSMEVVGLAWGIVDPEDNFVISQTLKFTCEIAQG